MKDKRAIGKIMFEFDEREINEIANEGNLMNFVNKATDLFRANLKAELVNSVSAGSTSLFRMDIDDFGTGGPIGPIPHVFMELEEVAKKMREIEILIGRTGRTL